MPLTVIFLRAARELAHNNGCGPLPKKNSGWSESEKIEVWNSADIINLFSMRGGPFGYDICCVRLLPEHEIVDPDKWKACLYCAVLSHVNRNEPLSVVIDNE